MPITNRSDAVICVAQIARQLRYTAQEMNAAGLASWPSQVEACADELDRIVRAMKDYR
jgi:hypothetical protein